MRFNLDNPVFTALGKVVDCAWLSILWLLCCLPVVTIGVSSTAMYYTVHKVIRGGRGYVSRTFFTALKDNFKQATLPYLVWLIAMAVLVCDALITREVLLTGSKLGAFFYLFLVMLVVVMMWGRYLFSYTARFANTVKATLRNSFILAVRHLPWSLLLIVISAAAAVLIWLLPILTILIPTTAVLLFDLILERLFRKYMTPEDLAREEELDHLEE